MDDIFKAKKERKLGVIFHFQGTTPFEDEINSVEPYHRLGVRMCQLCYNDKDLVGCGCAVEDDTGLTEFGGQVIKEMNRLGIDIDCAHTGYKTSMDAIAIKTPKNEITLPLAFPRTTANNHCDRQANGQAFFRIFIQMVHQSVNLKN